MNASYSYHHNGAKPVVLAQITRLGKAKHYFTNRLKYYSQKYHACSPGWGQARSMDHMDCCQRLMHQLVHQIHQGYTSSSVVLLKLVQHTVGVTYITTVKPVMMTQYRLFHFISKFGFLTARQYKLAIIKAMHHLPEETEQNVEKKVRLSRYYLALTAAVPDNAILSIPTITENQSLNMFIQMVSHDCINIKEVIAYIKKEHENAKKSLRAIKTIIRNQINTKSAAMMFLTTELENNKKYMHMSRKQIRHAVNQHNLY